VLIHWQAIEDGEDIEELAERTRATRGQPVYEGEATPPPEPTSSRGRKKKGRPPGPSAKRKREVQKQMSVTPSIPDEDDDDRGNVRDFDFRRGPLYLRLVLETPQDN
jgi:ATP-dependent helicase STH1/SNF2